jgi:hypothetical protein
MTERRALQRYPLTADLAGVLESARQERAPRQDRGPASWSGAGAAVLRMAKVMADRWPGRRAGAAPPAHARSA